MKSPDYKPPTRNCFVCGKPFVPRADKQPVCLKCWDAAKRRDQLGNRIVRRRLALKPMLNADDRVLMESCGIPSNFTYERKWARQHGQCKICRRRSASLRVVLNKRRTGVKRLVCSRCSQRLKSAEKP